MAEVKILIIGAGLAGLSLGQGLLQAGIDFQIFERDQAASFRAQGYRIRIDQHGGNSLKRLLPPQLFQIFEATSSEVVPGGHRLDAKTGAESLTEKSTMPLGQGQAWNVDRTVLRNVLLTGLIDRIQFGKKLERYELVEGCVTAHFADGSCVEGSMILGGDGIRSQVRKQMLPNQILLDTEGRAVFGKTVIEGDIFSKIPKEIGKGLTLTGAPDEPRIKLFCDVMKFDRSISTSPTPDAQIALPEDYVYWVLVFQKACSHLSDEEISKLSNAGSAELATKLTSGWASNLRALMTHQLPQAASTLFFYMAKPPIELWDTDIRVTLMGDAAHPMPPVGGVGANVAFQDAADLLDVIKAGLHVQELAQYETVLRDRSNQALIMAAGGAGRFFGMKPIADLKSVNI